MQAPLVVKGNSTAYVLRGTLLQSKYEGERDLLLYQVQQYEQLVERCISHTYRLHYVLRRV
jgi:hypothetical protein